MNRSINRSGYQEKGWLLAVYFLLFFLMLSGILEILYVEIIFKIHNNNTLNSYSLYQKLKHDPSKIHLLIFSQFLQLGAVILSVLFFNKTLDRNMLEKFRTITIWKADLFSNGSILGIFLISTIVLIISLNGSLLSINQPDIFQLANYFILFLAVSVVEELVFRGIILTKLTKSIPPFFSLLISSFLFASIHLFNLNITLIAFINLILAGYLFGIIFLRTQNIWYVVGLHLTWNYCQGPIYGFEVSGFKVSSLFNVLDKSDYSFVTGGQFGLEGSVITSLLLLITIAFFLLTSSKLKNHFK